MVTHGFWNCLIFIKFKGIKRSTITFMLKIIDIRPDSPFIGEVQPGNRLVSINGKKIRDILDYIFLSADEELELEFLCGDETVKLLYENDYNEDLGLEFPQMKPAECGNDCVFCFINQCPPGVRRTLNVKDEDYRFSFLHGNFITLSNIGKSGIARILEYRLSPLYISVHAMNGEARRKLLNGKKDDRFIQKFETLANGGITLHTQIVVVPGYNDGEILKDTIQRLGEYFPSVASIGIIPVGLTKHRKSLPELRLLNSDEANLIIGLTENFRKDFIKKYDDPLIYAADEMFIIAGLQFPTFRYYRDFPQIENGIGMVRTLLDDFKKEKSRFPKKANKNKRIILVTGTSMAPVFEENILPVLNKIEGISCEVVEVPNRFFGETVNVAGLLVGGDIVSALKDKSADLIVLPPDCLNYDDLFLDDMSLAEFIGNFEAVVKVFDSSFLRII